MPNKYAHGDSDNTGKEQDNAAITFVPSSLHDSIEDSAAALVVAGHTVRTVLVRALARAAVDFVFGVDPAHLPSPPGHIVGLNKRQRTNPKSVREGRSSRELLNGTSCFSWLDSGVALART